MATQPEFHAVPTESHAREFLASERTFLAWIRTSIAIIGFGFAIMRFDAWIRQISQGPGSGSGPKASLPIGGLMVLLGGAMAALGAWHYRRTNKQILEGKVQASNRLVLSISASVVLLSIAVIIYLVLRGEY